MYPQKKGTIAWKWHCSNSLQGRDRLTCCVRRAKSLCRAWLIISTCETRCRRWAISEVNSSSKRAPPTTITNNQWSSSIANVQIELPSSRCSRMTVKGTQKTASKTAASFLRNRPPFNISKWMWLRRRTRRRSLSVSNSHGNCRRHAPNTVPPGIERKSLDVTVHEAQINSQYTLLLSSVSLLIRW